MSRSDADNQLVGQLSIIGMHGSEEFVQKVDRYIREWRGEDKSFITKAACPRFGTGEAKGIIYETVRGHDVYIFCDCFNYGVTYTMFGMDVPMSPDDHFQDLKRIIAAAGGKPRRITVIMPMLYEGRQHRRGARESLDCALALHELVNMGVTNIITFDAHDARVQNAIPLSGFENVLPNYQMIKALKNTVPDFCFDCKNAIIISPDEGGINRAMYYASVLEMDLGMFYKRRDYSTVINGRNPIVAHEYLGNDVAGKDVIIIDDMISSGDSILDIAYRLKSSGARRVFVFVTFGLFANGLDKFDEAYKAGKFDKIFTTNLIYVPESLKQREWYSMVDMSKFIALIIDTLNYDKSISSLLDPVDKINKLLGRGKNIDGEK
ncbi:MAG: ribose-phosphate pyrophosphokinase [Clostridiales bacterium]|nr:ribose-phosphate pyrophosphokinase [Clostridiales bacterium]